MRTCPVCKSELVERINRATGVPFLGCERWPVCTFSCPLPADEVMRRQGATALPGFE